MDDPIKTDESNLSLGKPVIYLIDEEIRAIQCRQSNPKRLQGQLYNPLEDIDGILSSPRRY